MKKITTLSKTELNVIKGGTGRRFFIPKNGPFRPEDWNPNMGWEGEGPNGDQHFPG